MLSTHKRCTPNVFISFVCRRGSVLPWVLLGFLNTGFNLEVLMREKFRGGGFVRIAKRAQADYRTLRLWGQNGTAKHPLSVCFQTSEPQMNI